MASKRMASGFFVPSIPLFATRYSPLRNNMFDKILIANRGEIALARACAPAKGARHPRPSRCIPPADADAMHVRACRRERLHRAPPPSKDSYLNIPALLAACENHGAADAVHPGLRPFSPKNAPPFAEILAEPQSGVHRSEGRAHPP